MRSLTASCLYLPARTPLYYICIIYGVGSFHNYSYNMLLRFSWLTRNTLMFIRVIPKMAYLIWSLRNLNTKFIIWQLAHCLISTPLLWNYKTPLCHIVMSLLNTAQKIYLCSLSNASNFFGYLRINKRAFFVN